MLPNLIAFAPTRNPRASPKAMSERRHFASNLGRAGYDMEVYGPENGRWER
jgi:hypothetical protein